MFRKLLNSRLNYSLIATSSAAGSTLLYLIILYTEKNSAAFVNTYSVIGMLSAWLNNILFFLVLPWNINKNRVSALLIYLSTILTCIAINFFIFSIALTLSNLGFIASLCLPILFAPSYGFHLRLNKYRATYKRIVILNIFYIIAVFPVFFFPSKLEAIYLCTSLILPIAFFWWLQDKYFQINSLEIEKRKNVFLFRKIFNPALPLLERVLWDQFVLKLFLLESLTYNIFAFSKLLSFSGTVLFSYYTQRTLSGNLKNSLSARIWYLTFSICLTLILTIHAFSISIAPEFLLLVSQLIGWSISTSLLIFYEANTKQYWHILSLWLCDFILRSYAAKHLQLEEYAKKMLLFSFILAFLIIFIDFFRRGKSPSKQ